MWNNSHEKLTGNWQNAQMIKVEGKIPPNQVGWEKSIRLGPEPWKGSERKTDCRVGSHPWSMPQTGYPSPKAWTGKQALGCYENGQTGAKAGEAQTQLKRSVWVLGCQQGRETKQPWLLPQCTGSTSWANSGPAHPHSGLSMGSKAANGERPDLVKRHSHCWR